MSSTTAIKQMKTTSPRRIVERIAVVVVILLCIWFVFIVGSTVNALFVQPTLVKRHLSGSYKNIELPSYLSLQQTAGVGDPIDSPESYGWRYTYSSPMLDKAKISGDLQKSLINAGFTVTSAAAPQPAAAGETDSSKEYKISAKKDTENIKLSMSIYASVDRSDASFLSVYTKEIN